jgi:hypothetical protein
MSKQRGPWLLLILCAVLALRGGLASIVQEPARQQASVCCGAAALHMPSATDKRRGGSSRGALCLMMSAIASQRDRFFGWKENMKWESFPSCAGSSFGAA